MPHTPSAIAHHQSDRTPDRGETAEPSARHGGGGSRDGAEATEASDTLCVLWIAHTSPPADLQHALNRPGMRVTHAHDEFEVVRALCEDRVMRPKGSRVLLVSEPRRLSRAGSSLREVADSCGKYVGDIVCWVFEPGAQDVLRKATLGELSALDEVPPAPAGAGPFAGPADGRPATTRPDSGAPNVHLGDAGRPSLRLTGTGRTPPPSPADGGPDHAVAPPPPAPQEPLLSDAELAMLLGDDFNGKGTPRADAVPPPPHTPPTSPMRPWDPRDSRDMKGRP